MSFLNLDSWANLKWAVSVPWQADLGHLVGHPPLLPRGYFIPSPLQHTLPTFLLHLPLNPVLASSFTENFLSTQQPNHQAAFSPDPHRRSWLLPKSPPNSAAGTPPLSLGLKGILLVSLPPSCIMFFLSVQAVP